MRALRRLLGLDRTITLPEREIVPAHLQRAWPCPGCRHC